MNKLMLLLACLLVISCKNEDAISYGFGGNSTLSKSSAVEEMSMDQEPPRTASPPPENENQRVDEKSKIIKNGNMQFEVDELEKSKRKINDLLKKLGGYYENEVLNAYSHRKSYSLQIRVPNAQFDSLVVGLESGIGKLTNKSINTQDVTEEYRDLNIRLENKLAYLAQYKQILKKARTIKEILEVQEKIRRIEEELESKKGRINFLDSKVKFSNLNVQITQSIEVIHSTDWSIGKRMKRAFKNGAEMFVGFFIGLINFWPFLIILTIIFLGRKRILSVFKRKKKA